MTRDTEHHEPERAVGSGPSHDAGQEPLAVVGVGASAGGIEALRNLFEHIRSDTKLAFVVVLHLSPTHRSLLAETLATACSIPVLDVADGMRVQAGHVYVTIPGIELRFAHHALEVRTCAPGTRRMLSIDRFFESLAADLRSRAIGVVLSGTGADGTEGLRAIKEQGGITLAQTPESAQFDSMPRSAIDAGVVDSRLSPEEIAHELDRLARHGYLTATGDASSTADPDESLVRILARVREVSGTDFASYKSTSLMRRIGRRMALRRSDDLAQYARQLEEDPDESRRLADDILVHVTAFFRDPEVFDVLKREIFPEIVAHKDPDGLIKVWVPGCSTGEEVYSLAIALSEFLRDAQREATIRLFGSDLSSVAIERARAGVYSDDAVRALGPERLKAYFTATPDGYRINKDLRDCCVFVVHDLTRDAAFAKLDLISCRNVMIYFGRELQQRVVRVFHQCLNVPGFLVLGNSEGGTGFQDIFRPVDRAHRIFARTGSGSPAWRLGAVRTVTTQPSPREELLRPRPCLEAQRHADHLLLARYAPPGVIVDENFDVVQFRGRTGMYLEQAPGHPQTSVLKMAREGLLPVLHQALVEAKQAQAAVRRENVRVWSENRTRSITLEVQPLLRAEASVDTFYLVLFEETPAEGTAPLPSPAPGADPRAEEHAAELLRLRHDQAGMHQFLQSVLAEQQGASDDFVAANEELVAANEELQTTNEELESAKEELQSSNEELSTLNDELRERNRELDRLASDLSNVLEVADIPIVIIDSARRIARLTPRARAILNIIPADIGRPIGDIRANVDVDDLDQRVQRVIASGIATEDEVQDRDGRWHRMHIRPYRALDGRPDGAVLSLLDIDDLKRVATDAEVVRDSARAIVETIQVPLVVLAEDLTVLSANSAYHLSYGAAEPAESCGFFELGGGAWDSPALREILENLDSPASTPAVELERSLPGEERPRTVLVSARRLPPGGGTRGILVALEDVTLQRTFERQRAELLQREQEARLEAERANEAKDLFLATLSHELRTPLTPVIVAAAMLQADSRVPAELQRAVDIIRRNTTVEARLIDDLLDVTRIARGKIELDRRHVDVAAVVRDAVEVCRANFEARGQELEVHLPDAPLILRADPARLQQVFWNILQNAAKFTPREGHVAVRCRAGEHGEAIVEVTDDGMGIDASSLSVIFSALERGADGRAAGVGGLGLGLAISKSLVELHGGSIEATSPGPGLGATFRVRLPLESRVRNELLEARDGGAVAASSRRVHLLLVDDHGDTAFILGEYLKASGHRVEVAADLAAALAATEGDDFDVILSDINLPDGSGLDLMNTLRGRGSRSIGIALSGYGRQEDIDASRAAGFSAHLVKPIDPDRLQELIGRLVEQAVAGEWKQG